MADNAADVAVVFVVGSVGGKQRRLQYAGGKIDVVHAGAVVGVDGGRGHGPLSAIDGRAHFGELAAILKLDGALCVPEGVSADDGELRIIAPVVGIANLIGDGVQ